MQSFRDRQELLDLSVATLVATISQYQTSKHNHPRLTDVRHCDTYLHHSSVVSYFES